MELDALPLDLLALKCEVCRWEGNVTGLAEGIKEFDKIGYKLLSMEYEHYPSKHEKWQRKN